jgi:ABC-type Fe3+-hydroxamate transport system substrate-binding protein
MRKPLALAAACLLTLAACGSSTKSDSAAKAASTAAPAKATTSAAPATTTPATTAPATTAPAKPASTAAPAKPAGPAVVDVTLKEWAIDAPATIKAGDITLNVKNGGAFPHELVVMKGDSYPTLPLAANGSVDEAKLAAGALLGRTQRIGGGGAEAKTFSLTPGNYVFVCNLGGGNNSHAKAGQVLSVTVTA